MHTSLPKILLLGSEIFREELRAIGHEVICAGPFSTADVRLSEKEHRYSLIESRLPKGFHPDVLLQVETLGRLRYPLDDIHEVRLPRVLYAVDCHLNWMWSREYAQCFDQVLVTQASALGDFGMPDEKLRVLPWCYDEKVFYEDDSERIYDIVFVGAVDAETRRKRYNILQRLADQFSLQIFGDKPTNRLSEAEMASLYRQAKIVVNESILGDLNFRYFEALACGALLLTEGIGENLSVAFNSEQHLASFTPDSLESQAQYFLEHPDEREQRAAAGRKHCQERHTRRVRAKELSNILQSMPSPTAVASEVACAALGRSYAYLLRAGLVDRRQGLQRATALLAQASTDHDQLLRACCLLELEEIEAAGNVLSAALQGTTRDLRIPLTLGILFRLAKLADESSKMLRFAGAMAGPAFAPYGKRWEQASLLSSHEGELYFLIAKLLQANNFQALSGFNSTELTRFPLQAVEAFSLSLALGPTNAECLSEFAKHYFASGLFVRAAEIFELCARLSPLDAATTDLLQEAKKRAYFPSSLVVRPR